jgi:4-amino-4-deoxy-L-arabinose transferase-like glycosyltransferase
LLSAGLRLQGLCFGLPAQLHPDEPFLFASARQLRTHGVITHRIGASYPPLYVRLLALQQSAAAALGGGELRESTLFVLGRGLTVLLSLGCLAVGYQLARDLAGPGAGLWAAALLAVNPALVEHARYMTVDTAVTLLVLLTVLLSLRALDRPGPLSLGALAVGLLAVATKYNAALVLLVPLYVQIRGCRTERRCLIRQLGASALAMLLAFWLLAVRYRMFESLHVPYTISGRFLDKEHALTLVSLRENAFALLRGSAGTLPVIVAGLVLAGRLPRPLYEKLGLIIGYVIAFTLLMSLFPEAGMRQFLPAVALTAVAGGVLGQAAIEVLARRRGSRIGRWITAAAVLGLLVPSAAQAAAQGSLLRRKDTRVQTLDWFRQHAPPGSVVVIEYDAVEFLTGDDGRALPFRPVVVRSLLDVDASSARAGQVKYLVADSRARGGYFDGARGSLRGFVMLAALPSQGRPGPDRVIFGLPDEGGLGGR